MLVLFRRGSQCMAEFADGDLAQATQRISVSRRFGLDFPQYFALYCSRAAAAKFSTWLRISPRNPNYFVHSLVIHSVNASLICDAINVCSMTEDYGI